MQTKEKLFQSTGFAIVMEVKTYKIYAIRRAEYWTAKSKPYSDNPSVEALFLVKGKNSELYPSSTYDNIQINNTRGVLIPTSA